MSVASLLHFSSATAETFLTQMNASYGIKESGFLRESVGEGANKDQVAFNWSVGVVLTAECGVARLNRSRIANLNQVFESADRYWNPNGPVAGFDVLPGPPYPNDRYYDDNAWIAMALVEAYELTGNRKWLTRAEQTVKFVLSGGDSKLDGGIYWRERDKASKNTCSNGPAAAACLAVYHHTKNIALLNQAKAIYAWTKKNLLDPEDGLYWDNRDLTGKLEKTKWSYNSALMLRSAKDLFKVTKEQQYQTDAEALEAASIKQWVKPDGSISDELQFSHLLFENLDPKKFNSTKAVETLLKAFNEKGYFAVKWSEHRADKEQKLIIQASGVRVLATYELWKRQGLVRS